MDHSTWLLLDLLLAVVGVVVLISWLKVNAFIALAVASLAAGVGSGTDVSKIADAFERGVGNMLGKVAMVIGLGTVLRANAGRIGRGTAAGDGDARCLRTAALGRGGDSLRVFDRSCRCFSLSDWCCLCRC